MFNKKLLKKYTGIAFASLMILGGVCETSYATETLQIDQYAIDSSQIDEPTLYSNPWYYATITLPTSGDDWWITTDRSKTRNSPGTAVNKPSYAVVSSIFRGSTTTNIGKNTSHGTGKDSIGWHSISKHETVIRGAFRNQFANSHNNRVDLRWSP